jgi:hypothetical protein
MKKTSVKREREVADWNRRHGVGALVKYHRIIGEGEGVATKTRSEAWVLSGHTAVVMVEGVSGCVALEAVRPLGRSTPQHAPESIDKATLLDNSTLAWTAEPPVVPDECGALIGDATVLVHGGTQ